MNERLAEYAWKPHRICLAQTKLSPASFDCYMREKQRGKVSSNPRFQTVLFQEYSAANPWMNTEPLVARLDLMSAMSLLACDSKLRRMCAALASLRNVFPASLLLQFVLFAF